MINRAFHVGDDPVLNAGYISVIMHLYFSSSSNFLSQTCHYFYL